MTDFKRWDIVKIPIAPAAEHRPALVIVAGEIYRTQGLLWVLMITSIRNKHWPGDIEICDTITAGLGVPSVIRTSKIITVEAVQATSIGTLEGLQRKQVGEQVFANMGITGIS
jgi:hypothetical protein